MLGSNSSERTRKKMRKHRIDDAFNLHVDCEVLNQMPKDYEKEKKKKIKHKYEKEHEIEDSCEGWLVPEIEKLPQPETSRKQKKKRKHQHENEDECSDGNSLVEPVSAAISDHVLEPETSSKPKKKKKHGHEKHNEIAVEDDGNFMLPNGNLSEAEPETSHKRKKKTTYPHEKYDEIGIMTDLTVPPTALSSSSFVSCATVTLESNKVQKKERYKNADDLLKNLHFDIDWILAPVASSEHVTSNEVQEEINTLLTNMEDENDWIIPSIDRSVVELSQESSDNVPSTLNVLSQEALTDVPSAHESSAETSDNVPSTLNVPSQEALTGVPFSHESSAESLHNVPSTLNVPSQEALTDVPFSHESSAETSDNVPPALNVPSQEAVTDDPFSHESSVETSDNVPSTLNVPSQEAVTDDPFSHESSVETPDNLPPVLNVPLQEPFTDVPSAHNASMETSDNVPSELNVPFQEGMINVPFATDSPVESSRNVPSTTNVQPTENIPCATNFSSTRNVGTNLSQKASINIPSEQDSPVDLSQNTVGHVSLTHNSVFHRSKMHSSELQPADDLPVDLSRKSSAYDSSVRRRLRSHQSQEHSANDSSVENSVIVSSQARPSPYFNSAKRRLFTEEVSNELPAVSKKSLPARKVRCVKTCKVEAPEGVPSVSKNSLPSLCKNSSPAVSKKSLPVKRVRCVKTCTIANQEDNSENGQPSQKSVIRSTSQKHSLATKQEKRTKHRDLPKQPASVYVRFMRDCRRTLLEENPNLTQVQVFTEAGIRYRNLTAEDKEKYVKEFLLETKEYNAVIKMFLENHPEHRNHWASEKRCHLEKQNSGSVRIISGQQLYINKQTQEYLAAHVEDNIRNIMAFYRKEWKHKLTDQEKVEYILEAKKLNAENAAAAAADGPKTVHCDSDKPVTASTLKEIEEQFLQENLVPPPLNGYQLFLKENTNSELPFGEINRQWKSQLSQEERNDYTKRAKLARETYKKNVAEFEKKEEAEAEFRNLPLPNKLRNALKEEHRLLVCVRKKAIEKRKKHSDIKTGRPPVNGYRLFIKEQMATVKDLDFKLRFAELNAQWKNRLSQEERDEYSARAKAAYDKFMEEHPGLDLDDLEEKSSEQDCMERHGYFEKTQTSKKRMQLKEGGPTQPRNRQCVSSEDVSQMANINT